MDEFGKVTQKISPNGVVFSMSPVATKGQTVKAQINGITLLLLIDTGSAITLIGGDLWRKCKHDHEEPELWIKKLVSVDGSHIKVLGSCDMRILSDQTFVHIVLVVEHLTSEGILGVNFLQKNKCVVNLGKNILRILGHSINIPLSHNPPTGESSPRKVNVVVAQTTCIPARSKVEVLPKTHDTIGDIHEWLLEGK